MKMSFLNQDKPLKTMMIQSDNLEYIYQMIGKGHHLNADAFGLQVEKLPKELCTTDNLKKIFEVMDRPVYVTSYRRKWENPPTDDELAEILKNIAKAGGTLVDVMGDYFDKHPDELTEDPVAVEKQKKLIRELHELGAEVLMSSHVLRFIPAERVLEIALAQQERGADIVKIVTRADTPEEEVENLRIITLLKKELKVPFLYLCGGDHNRLVRRIGPMLGACMWLCVPEYNEYATKSQPELKKLNKVIEGFE